jgi:hypothetical protein
MGGVEGQDGARVTRRWIRVVASEAELDDPAAGRFVEVPADEGRTLRRVFVDGRLYLASDHPHGADEPPSFYRFPTPKIPVEATAWAVPDTTRRRPSAGGTRIPISRP